MFSIRRVNLFGSAAAIAVAITLPVPAHATAITAIDEFIITRSLIDESQSQLLPTSYEGQTIFYRDSFGDGAQPSSGGSFFNGTAGTYAVLGAYPSTAESGGKLALDSSLGGAFVNADGNGRTLQRSVLPTNTETSGANSGAGLKRLLHTFSVFGLFDLKIPPLPGDGYGILVNDSGPSGGTESIDLFVRREENNTVVIRFQEQDFLTPIINTIALQQLTIPTGADQIELRLQRSALATDAITAAYRFWANGSAVTSSFTGISGSAPFFTTNGWARGGFFAVEKVQAVPEPGTVALLLLGAACLLATMRQRIE